MAHSLRASIAATVALFLAAPLARANHVDFLTDGPFTQSGVGAGSTGSVTVPGSPNILGSTRYFRVGTISSFAGNDATASLAAGGPLVLTSETFAAGDWEFGYGTETLGQGAGAPLDANFVDAPSGPDWDSIVIEIDVPGVDVGNVDGIGILDLTVSNDASGVQSFAPRNVNVANEGDFVFLHSELPGFDFSNVDGVSFRLRAVNPSLTPVISSDFNVLGVTRETRIPEPATLALFAAGGLATLSLRRRKN